MDDDTEEAMAEFRALWYSFLLGESEDFYGMRWPTEAIRDRLDALQKVIAKSARAWRKFSAALPGYREHWEAISEKMEDIRQQGG